MAKTLLEIGSGLPGMTRTQFELATLSIKPTLLHLAFRESLTIVPHHRRTV